MERKNYREARLQWVTGPEHRGLHYPGHPRDQNYQTPPDPARFPDRLLDISGRKVLDLHAGANDVSRLAPGVYLVRSATGDERSVVSKVVIMR
jgi:hypothetical protein